MTFASVDKVSENSRTHRLFTDYNQLLLETGGRATEKAVRTQHAEVLKNLDSILADAVKHYNNPGKAFE